MKCWVPAGAGMTRFFEQDDNLVPDGNHSKDLLYSIANSHGRGR